MSLRLLVCMHLFYCFPIKNGALYIKVAGGKAYLYGIDDDDKHDKRETLQQVLFCVGS